MSPRSLGFLFLACFGLSLAETAAMETPITWPAEWATKAPAVYPTTDHQADGVEALFYEGAPYKGKPTRVFAYLGVPADLQPGERRPAMVLIPGGGASALAYWVRLWTERGYVAICMDICGATPGPNPMWIEPTPHSRHEFSGPAGWGPSAETQNDAAEDQWPFHAAAAAVRAKALLAAHPAVDPERIGVSGISWGSVTLFWAAAATDWACAIPVYGCGFLGESGLLKGSAANPEGAAWLARWDPALYLPRARAKAWLWITGPVDFAFWMDQVRKSYEVAPGPRWLAIKPEMTHGHGGAGENQPEIFAFADACLRGGVPLPQPGVPTFLADGRAAAGWGLTGAVRSAELVWTPEKEDGPNRTWNRMPAAVEGTFAAAAVPAEAAAWYFHVTDPNGATSSSPHVYRP